MAEARRRFDPEFRAGAVRIVRETSKPIAQVARDRGINEGTLGNWVNKDIERRLPSNGGCRRRSGTSWPGSVGRTPNWIWSAMSSSAPWFCWSRRR
jgi:transposase-like protein